MITMIGHMTRFCDGEPIQQNPFLRYGAAQGGAYLKFIENDRQKLNSKQNFVANLFK